MRTTTIGIIALILIGISFSTFGSTNAYFSARQVTGKHLVSTWQSYLWCQTTQSDFNAGVLFNVDTASSPGDVKLTNVTNYTGWYTPSWSYRKKITINQTQVAATLTDFPVLINIPSDADLASFARADGYDILFTSSDGTTKLDHEIENFTISTGQLIAWVRIPSLSSAADTSIYLYFGNPTAANQQNVPGVWDTNFKGVWHLKEDPSGIAPQMLDSTSNTNHGTSGGTMNTSDQVAAKVNGGLDFDGSEDYLSTNYVQTNVTAYTIEAWINTSTASDLNVIVHDRGDGAGQSLTLSIGNSWGGGSGVPGDVAYGVDSDNIYIGVSSTNTVNDNIWHHVAGVWSAPSGTQIDPTQFRVYIDGNNATTINEAVAFGVPIPTSPLTGLYGTEIAYHPPWDTYLLGILDEIRISNSTRSADWIKTEYNNQNSPSTFYTVGTIERPPVAYAPFGTLASQVFNTTFPSAPWDLLAWDNTGWYSSNWNYRKKITINQTQVAATLTDFPVLINLTSDADLASSARADGYDILFTSSDGTTKLNHEIENFTVSTGKLIAWVKVPSVASSANTTIYMYYGYASSPNQQNPTGVWDTNFKGVWHLKEDPTGTAPQMLDSTSNANHGTSGGTMTTSDQVAAKVNGGLDFDGSNDNVSTNYVQTSVTAYTIEAWINTSTASMQRVIVHDRGSGLGRSLTLSIGGTYPSGPGVAGDVGYGVDSNNIYIGRYSTMTVNDNKWHHLVGVWTAPSGIAIAPAQFSIYIDGDVAATTPVTVGGATSPLTGLSGTQIARHQPWNTHFQGILDEIRISNSTRSAAWIKTEYNNQNSPSTFYTVGTMEPKTTVAGTNITFQVRASNTIFAMGAASPPWINASWPSPVTTVLPSGQLPRGMYLQWRANLTTTDTTNTPILNEVRVWYSDP